MALPASGPISMDNMNTDRAIPSATQIDLDTAAIAYSIPTKPHGMDEFYGLSVPSPTPPSPPPTPPPPTYRIIQLGNPPGDNTTVAACAITSGLTKYISYSFAITNGLVIYDNSALTTQTYNSDPYSGNYAMLYDTNAGFRYAVTFDSAGVVNTVYDCLGGSPVPPSPPPTPPSPPPTPPSPTPTPPSPTPTPTPPPPPTPPYSYLLNNGGEATGPDACNEYNSFVRATYYSNQSSITTGTTLYLSDYVTTVPDGYYSNGTNYWYFGGGVTSDLGTACSPPPSPPPTPPSPPPTPPVCYTFNITNYDPYDTVTGTYTNCGGGSDSFSFTDTSGTSTNIGTICVLDGTTPTITSGGNGAASNSLVTC